MVLRIKAKYGSSKMELELLGVRRSICTVYRIAKSSYGEGKIYMKRISNMQVFAFSGLL